MTTNPRKGRKVKGTKRCETDTSNVKKKTERRAEFRRATQESHECQENRGWKSQGKCLDGILMVARMPLAH